MPYTLTITPEDIDGSGICCGCGCGTVGPGPVVALRNNADLVLPQWRIIYPPNEIYTGRKHLGYYPTESTEFGGMNRYVIQWPNESFVVKNGYNGSEFGSWTLSDHTITQSSVVSRYEADPFNHPWPGVVYSYDAGYSGVRAVQMDLTTITTGSVYSWAVSLYDADTGGPGANEIRWECDGGDEPFPAFGVGHTYTLAHNPGSRTVPSYLTVRAHATEHINLLRPGVPRWLWGWVYNTSDPDDYRELGLHLKIFRHDYLSDNGDYCEWPVQFSVDTPFTSEWGNTDPIVIVDSAGVATFQNDGAADLETRINAIGAAALTTFSINTVQSGFLHKADCVKIVGCAPQVRPHVVYDMLELECSGDYDRIRFFGDDEFNTWLFNYMNFNMGDMPYTDTPEDCAL